VRVVYSVAKDGLLTGLFDLSSATLTAELVTTYTYDDTDATMLDVSTSPGEQAPVTGVTVAKGVVTSDDITFGTVGGTDAVTGIIVYVNAGTRAGSTPLVFTDQRIDSLAINVTPNGGDITFSFDFLLKI
jgi:hypothetical protein